MALTWIQVYVYAAVSLLTFMCIESAIPKSSFYDLVHVSDIDIGVIAATYTNVRSKVSCGVKCSGIAAKSFYYVSNSSTCHCNTLCTDQSALTVAQSNITYGKLKQDLPSAGNYTNCQDIYMAGLRTNGTYTVIIGNTPVEVFCDLSDGGWTVFQKRFDGSLNFTRSWTDYVYGFGDLNGEFWLGLETVHQLSKGGCELLILLEAKPDNLAGQDAGFAHYTDFSIGDSSSYYTLNIGSFSGTVGDSLLYHNGSKFSTFDKDNDIHADHCSLMYDSIGWWYKNCQSTILNGQYFSTTYCAGIRWQLPWNCELLARSEMKFKC